VDQLAEMNHQIQRNPFAIFVSALPSSKVKRLNPSSPSNEPEINWMICLTEINGGGHFC